MSKPVLYMNSVVSLEYERPPTLAAREYAEAAERKKLMAHVCPSCDRVYTPPRGYCPICTVATGKAHERELADRGFLVTFTVTHKKGEDHDGQAWENIWATIMLDGTHIMVMGAIDGLAPDELRTGMHLRAIWDDDFSAAKVGTGYRNSLPGIDGWELSGEPDVPMEEVQKRISEATDS